MLLIHFFLEDLIEHLPERQTRLMDQYLENLNEYQYCRKLITSSKVLNLPSCIYGALYSIFLIEGTLNLKLSLSNPVTNPLPLSIGNSSNPLFLKELSVPKIPP